MRRLSLFIWMFFFSVEALAEPSETRISVNSTPQGASVFIDGQLVGKTPYEAIITPGEHRCKVVIEGYLPAEQSVLVAPGEKSQITVALTHDTFPMISLTGVPKRARVFIDGRRIRGSDPDALPPISVIPGSHTLKVKAFGYKPHYGNFTLDWNQQSYHEVDMYRTSSYDQDYYGFGLLGLNTAFVVSDGEALAASTVGVDFLFSALESKLRAFTFDTGLQVGAVSGSFWLDARLGFGTTFFRDRTGYSPILGFGADGVGLSESAAKSIDLPFSPYLFGGLQTIVGEGPVRFQAQAYWVERTGKVDELRLAGHVLWTRWRKQTGPGFGSFITYLQDDTLMVGFTVGVCACE